MSRTKRRAAARAGFTLIELLVVIAIIAVLVALTAGAVMRIMGWGPMMTARGEINGLVTAHAGFLKKFENAGYIPSRIRLREDMQSYNPADLLDKRSVTYLQKVFGSRLTRYINWSGRADFASTTQDRVYELMGEECLVFFLGGIPTPNDGTPNACLGFSTNPADPSAATTERIGPFYDFQPNRLVRETNTSVPVGTGPFFKYRDPFNAPGNAAYYVYLSSPYNSNPPTFSVTDSRQGVVPFVMTASPTRYLNNDAFQIISAGRDGKFGGGGLTWSVTSGYGEGQNGSDDISNFSTGELRLGQK